MTKEKKNLLNTDNISFILPTKNTLNYTMMAYRSIREYYPNNEIVMLDDVSNDGTWEWIEQQTKLDDNLRTYRNFGPDILGHTILYDLGIKMSKNALVTIFHSDMIASKLYLENMLKHWKPKVVVCATRIEPLGIYPESKEKELLPFGKEFFEFNREEFLKYVTRRQSEMADRVTFGMFAPWLISKEDFLNVGGHWKMLSPFPHEDFDIFMRWKLEGYKLIQSRDSFCYHFISKGHRAWSKNGIGNDDPMYAFYELRARRNYLRKWHKWMSHDEYRMPITHPVYNIAFVINNVSSIDFLHFVEPWATKIYVNPEGWSIAEKYLEKEQPTTKLNLSERVIKNTGPSLPLGHDICLEFSQDAFMANANENSAIITTLTDIISQGVEDNSELEYGIFRMKTGKIVDIAPTLVKVVN